MDFLENRSIPIKMRRSRPYKKNDQAYVEQKNFTHVRKIFKYDRINSKKLIELMNDIYKNYWNPLQNYFLPSYKIESKERVGSRIVKKYGELKTPAQRIRESLGTPNHIKGVIRSNMMDLDPITLKMELNKRLVNFREELDNYINQKAA
jgi:hypothetical protein